MRIELRDLQRRRIGQARLEPGQRPTRVRLEDAGREVFLDWEGAMDDAGHLRRCLACGCDELFQEKAFPQVTGVVVVMAFIGAAAGVFGLAENLPVLGAMIVVFALDLAILIFSRTRLVCYRCRTSYHDLPIARYHRSWDRSRAERYPPPVTHREQQSEEGERSTEPGVEPPKHRDAEPLTADRWHTHDIVRDPRAEPGANGTDL